MTLPTGTRSIDVNGIELHIDDHGTGTPVLMLHGWPDSSYLWRHQVPALVQAGFRTIAPDLRGFGKSDKPQEVEAYALAILLSDVIGIIDGLDLPKVHIVGHDWGATLAWELAIDAPDRVDRLVVLSVPHPGIPLTLEQREKGWYRLFFMFEGIAEAWLQQDDWSLFRELLRGNGDLDRYLVDLSRPGALTASLNWYRANLAPGSPTPPSRFPPVRAPTLAIWSDGDHYLAEERVVASERFVETDWSYRRIEGSSHWIPLDAPDVLNDLLLKWFA